MMPLLLTKALLLSLLLAGAGPAAAQGPEPDTTDWRSYFPLEVGNAWQYRSQESVPPDGNLETFLRGWHVEADTTVGGTGYFVLRSCDFAEEAPVSCPDVVLVRYDLDNAIVVARDASTGEEAWWPEIPCGLDAPFGDTVKCRGPGTVDGPYYTYGGYDLTVVVPPDTLEGMTVKGFSVGGISGHELAAGLGFTAFDISGLPIFQHLVYARVAGQEMGVPAFAFPTAAEPSPDAPGAVLALAVAPNPARDRAALVFHLPAPSEVTAALFDPLGRRVHAVTAGRLGAGAQRIGLDLGAVPPGVYVVRLTAGSDVASQKITVR